MERLAEMLRVYSSVKSDAAWTQDIALLGRLGSTGRSHTYWVAGIAAVLPLASTTGGAVFWGATASYLAYLWFLFVGFQHAKQAAQDLTA